MDRSTEDAITKLMIKERSYRILMEQMNKVLHIYTLSCSMLSKSVTNMNNEWRRREPSRGPEERTGFDLRLGGVDWPALILSRSRQIAKEGTWSFFFAWNFGSSLLIDVSSTICSQAVYKKTCAIIWPATSGFQGASKLSTHVSRVISRTPNMLNGKKTQTLTLAPQLLVELAPQWNDHYGAMTRG
jgi:hypothetical protein